MKLCKWLEGKTGDIDDSMHTSKAVSASIASEVHQVCYDHVANRLLAATIMKTWNAQSLNNDDTVHDLIYLYKFPS